MDDRTSHHGMPLKIGGGKTGDVSSIDLSGGGPKLFANLRARQTVNYNQGREMALHKTLVAGQAIFHLRRPQPVAGLNQ